MISGPVQFVLDLMKTWDLTEEKVAILLGLQSDEGHTARNILRGIEPLKGRDMKKRIYYLLQIRKTLNSLLQDE